MNRDDVALEARGVSKHFLGVSALTDVSLTVRRAGVTCLLGDNGAGKSTLIKILSGVHAPDSGELLVDGQKAQFKSPRHALDHGISTVYQDLAMIPLMPVARNFFLGRELNIGKLIWRRVDWLRAEEITIRELDRVGIHLRDANQPVGTLSGGERQSVAIARAMYFGASVLILDEPTSALGVKEAAIVLRLVRAARDQGLAILLITHNAAHAHAVGDDFVVLQRGRVLARLRREDAKRAELQDLMAGGVDMAALTGTSGPIGLDA
ncbi:MAG TPA: ATP-binding cassette domain-containing protein [Solirubrobacteraceae bacterium]